MAHYPTKNRITFILSLIVLWASGCATPRISPESEAPNRLNWVQLGAGKTVIARSLSPQSAECPEIHFDGPKGTRSDRMVARTSSSADFPTTICEFSLPNGTKKAWIGSEPLHLPKTSFDRIYILGDTGCRVKGSHIQDCNDPKKWPFPKIADEVAKQDPDLVVHVGDYYYREAACPANKQGCVGSPHGDNWESWKADFFTPARNLLKASPWIFVRGNHEDCHRGGKGWFRFLDASSYPKECLKYTDPYRIQTNPEFIVFDSSLADEFSLSDTLREKYTQQASLMKSMPISNGWLLTHRPPAMNPVLVQAFENQIPQGVNLMASGHLHFFQALNQKGGPSQIIVGNSGSALNELSIVRNFIDLYRGKLKEIAGVSEFGYVAMERQKETNWKLTAYGLGKKVILECFLNGAQIECKKN